MINNIVNYLENDFGFIIVPCSIPKNGFEYFKRNLYIIIMNRFGIKTMCVLRKI